MNVLGYLLPVLVLGWALLGVRNYRKLKELLKAGDRSALLREYQSTILGEVIGGVVAIGAIGTAIFDSSDTFDVHLNGIGIGMLIGACVGFIMSIIFPPTPMKPKNRGMMPDFAALVPRSSKEKYWYAAVAVAAGIGEELVFRGAGLRLLEHLGLTGVALIIISALIFGLVHLYQGTIGVIVNIVMGVILALIYIQTGSLWWAILAHVIIDLRILVMVHRKKL